MIAIALNRNHVIDSFYSYNMSLQMLECKGRNLVTLSVRKLRITSAMLAAMLLQNFCLFRFLFNEKSFSGWKKS